MSGCIKCNIQYMHVYCTCVDCMGWPVIVGQIAGHEINLNFANLARFPDQKQKSKLTN